MFWHWLLLCCIQVASVFSMNHEPKKITEDEQSSDPAVQKTAEYVRRLTKDTRAIAQLSEHMYAHLSQLQKAKMDDEERAYAQSAFSELFFTGDPTCKELDESQSSALIYQVASLFERCEECIVHETVKNNFRAIAYFYFNQAQKLGGMSIGQHEVASNRISRLTKLLIEAGRLPAQYAEDEPIKDSNNNDNFDLESEQISSDAGECDDDFYDGCVIVNTVSDELKAMRDARKAPVPNQVSPARVSKKNQKKSPVTPGKKKKEKKEKEDPLVLLERVAYDVEHVSPEERIEALRQLGGIYASGNKKFSVQKNTQKARQYTADAIELGSAGALLDMMKLEFRAKKYDAILEHAQKVEFCSKKTLLQKAVARGFEGVAHIFKDGREGEIRAIKALRDVHTWYGTASLHEFTQCLPTEFYKRMHERISESYKVMKAHRAHVYRTEIMKNIRPSRELVLPMESATEWVYLMARFYLEDKTGRFNQHKGEAVKWMQYAAEYQCPSAQIYLGCHDNLGISDYVRSKYLDNGMSFLSKLTSQEIESAAQAYNELAAVGYMGAVYRMVASMHCADDLPCVYQAMNKFFPKIKIDRCSGKYYQKAKAIGLIDALEKEASSHWVARGLLSALEIAYTCDCEYGMINESFTGENAIALTEKAIERIEDDVQQHPTLKAILATGYAALADNIGFVSLGKSIQTLQERNKTVELMRTYFNKAIDLNDDPFARFSLAVLLLARADEAPQNEVEGISLLRKLIAEGQEEFILYAYEQLIQYHLKKNKWGEASDYLQKLNQHQKQVTTIYESEAYRWEQLAKAVEKKKPHRGKKGKQLKEAESQETRMRSLLADVFTARKDCFAALKKLEELEKIEPDWLSLLGEYSAVAALQAVIEDIEEGVSSLDERLQKGMLNRIAPFQKKLKACDIRVELLGEFSTTPDTNQKIARDYMAMREMVKEFTSLQKMAAGEKKNQRLQILMHQLKWEKEAYSVPTGSDLEQDIAVTLEKHEAVLECLFKHILRSDNEKCLMITI